MTALPWKPGEPQLDLPDPGRFGPVDTSWITDKTGGLPNLGDPVGSVLDAISNARDIFGELDPVALNPQPLPPRGEDTIWPSSGNDEVSLNPQPLPPHGADTIWPSHGNDQIEPRFEPDFDWQEEPGFPALPEPTGPELPWCGTPGGSGPIEPEFVPDVPIGGCTAFRVDPIVSGPDMLL